MKAATLISPLCTTGNTNRKEGKPKMHGESNTKPKRRARRLARNHENVRCLLYRAFDAPADDTWRLAISRTDETRVKRHLTRLTNLAGITPENARACTFKAAMQAIYNKVQDGFKPEEAFRCAALIGEVLDEYDEKDAARKDAARRGTTRVPVRKAISDGEFSPYPGVTIQDGAEMTLALVDVADLYTGEFVCVWNDDANKWDLCGPFGGATAEGFTVRSCQYNMRSGWQPYRIVSFIHTLEPQEATAEVTENMLRIIELRKRLDNLHEPENEAARFKVAREIYDLEHTQASTEEWPDEIAA